jgi:hypothetical protein
MSGAATGEGSYVYAVSCRRLGLFKIGVADDPGKRLRELQVGSPAELTLAYMQPYAERRDAVAVCEELYRCFAGRRVRGRWYRLTLEEVRHGLARRATVETSLASGGQPAPTTTQLNVKVKSTMHWHARAIPPDGAEFPAASKDIDLDQPI